MEHRIPDDGGLVDVIPRIAPTRRAAAQAARGEPDAALLGRRSPGPSATQCSPFSPSMASPPVSAIPARPRAARCTATCRADFAQCPRPPETAIVVGMADGFAQASGNAALREPPRSSAGTGHALEQHLHGVPQPDAAGDPSAGQQARSILPFEPFLYAERATGFPAHVRQMDSVEPARAEDVPLAIAARLSCRDAGAARGPVFVSVPVDDYRDRPCDPLPPSRVSARTLADPALLAEVAAQRRRRPSTPRSSPAPASAAKPPVPPSRASPSVSPPRSGPRLRGARPSPRITLSSPASFPAAREPIADHLAGSDLVLEGERRPSPGMSRASA